jgi:hypothetical protein
MAMQQKAVYLHHTVDPLHIRRRVPVPLRGSAQQSMDASVAVGRQLGDERLDRSQKLPVRQRWTTSAPHHGLPGYSKVRA